MTKNAPSSLKQFSFGGGDFARTSPNLNAFSSQTQVLNVAISFEEALKLHLAIGECIRKLNSYKRSTTAGKRTALNLAIHLSKGRVTVNETSLSAKPKSNGQPQTNASQPEES